MAVYYVATGKNTHSAVEGSAVRNPQGYDLFLHAKFKGRGFAVSEGRSGLLIGEGLTKDAARKDGLEKVNKFEQANGPGSFTRMIDRRVKEVGLTPRYRDLSAPLKPARLLQARRRKL